MKFLVPNYSCLQNPLLGGLQPTDSRSFSSQPNLLNPPPPNNIPGYATDSIGMFSAYTQEVNLKIL